MTEPIADDGTSNLIDRLTSRIFLAFAAASFFFYADKIDQETWVTTLWAFAGVNAVEKLGKSIVGAKNGKT